MNKKKTVPLEDLKPFVERGHISGKNVSVLGNALLSLPIEQPPSFDPMKEVFEPNRWSDFQQYEPGYN